MKNEFDGVNAAWESQKDQFRRGSTSAQANKALRNKEVLQYIKEHPGCTKDEIYAALGHGGFDLLQKYNLIYYEMIGDKAHWFPTNNQPKNTI